MNSAHKKGSLMMLIILLLAAIIVLGYFGISVRRDIAGNATVQDNLAYVWTEVKYIWETYLKDIVLKIWSWAFINIRNLPLGSGNGIDVPTVEMPTSTAPY